MMKNMRGIIEPYTLGFLISLIGGLILAPKIGSDVKASEPTTQTISLATEDKSKN